MGRRANVIETGRAVIVHEACHTGQGAEDRDVGGAVLTRRGGQTEVEDTGVDSERLGNMGC